MTTTGCLPIGPGTEKRPGQKKEGKKSEKRQKERQDTFQPQTLFPSCCFVSLQKRPDDGGWVGSTPERGENVCVDVCSGVGIVVNELVTSESASL